MSLMMCCWPSRDDYPSQEAYKAALDTWVCNHDKELNEYWEGEDQDGNLLSPTRSRRRQQAGLLGFKFTQPSQELLEEACREFDIAVQEAKSRIETVLPHMLFQEKHTTGWLWWRKTYYTYFKYFEGSMLQVSITPARTVRGLKRGWHA